MRRKYLVSALTLSLFIFSVDTYVALAQDTTPSETATPSTAARSSALSVLESPVTKLKGPIEAGPPLLAEGETATADFAYGTFERGWYLTALALAIPLAEVGDTSAHTLVGVLYETGYGIAQDKAKAASWYELASSQNDPAAAQRLAQFYLLGTGVEQDKKRAADLFEIAAAAGNPAAKYNLAIIYQEGEGRPYNEKKARELLREAADLNDPEAQYSLGLSYLEGLGGAIDAGQGAFWLGRAARRGHVSAQVYYGILRFQGKGVEPDQEEAADWFERAATAGNPVAMNRLARIYAYGKGRSLDPVAAAGWHYVARTLGISDLQLDGFAESLDEETLSAARKKAEQYSATLLPPGTDPGAGSP